MHQESLKQLTLMSELAHRNRKDNLNHSEYRHTPSEVADGHSSLGSNKEIDSENEDEHEDVGMDPADWGYPLHLDHDTGEKEEEEPGMIFWDWHWGNETSANNDEPSTLGPNRSYTQPGPQRSQRIPANAPWYPFPTKEYMIASLILGYLHNVIYHTRYNNLRFILTLCVVNFPHWDTIRRFGAKLREMTKTDVVENQTVLSNRTFSLSVKNIIANELANPLVMSHMEFVPHDPQGHDIHALDQSQKWREDLPRNLRVPMVTHGGKHFYICEPATIVVPIFFFKQGGREPLLQMHQTQIYPPKTFIWGRNLSRGNQLSQSLICAQNRVIRHVPITLYADDTSGNQSRRWNKHVSYCFTLSGLAPKLTNMEYNCHFIATSNSGCKWGGPLEIAEPIITELNELATHGSVAYDAQLGHEVAAIKLSLKEILRGGSWVLEADSAVPNGHIAYVESIWEVMPNVYYAKPDRAVKMGVQPENCMTIISKDFRSIYTPVKTQCLIWTMKHGRNGWQRQQNPIGKCLKLVCCRGFLRENVSTNPTWKAQRFRKPTQSLKPPNKPAALKRWRLKPTTMA
ncbi:hypothetical protein KEM48_006904 [Puccinia striiformis f. sp. tritici PST-130]|nr:hypothetical protein KEM48_006904 [Puccinia striiformis f. sp. tritici PST-130]